MNSFAERLANWASKGITISSCTPSEAISSALRAGRVSSLGVCAGATIETGWGSNVSTLCAPSMTARWPRCTPSKVPTATLARSPGPARRELASSSGNEMIFTLHSLLAGLRRQHGQDALEVEQRRVAPALPCRWGRDGVVHVEGSDRRTPELQAICILQIGDQRAHVGAGSAFDLIARARTSVRAGGGLAPQLAKAVHGDDPLRHARVLPPARPAVGALAFDFHRRVAWWALADLPRRERWRIRRHAAGMCYLTLRVARARERAEACDDLIALAQRHQHALGLRRPAEQHEQQTRCKGIQRARVPGAHACKRAPHGGDDIVRGHPGGLVDEKHPVQLPVPPPRPPPFRRAWEQSARPRPAGAARRSQRAGRRSALPARARW